MKPMFVSLWVVGQVAPSKELRGITGWDIIGLLPMPNASRLVWKEDNDKYPLYAKFVVPWDSNYSKNRRFGFNRAGGVFKKKEVSDLERNIITELKLTNFKWRVNKVYLDIMVEKPSMRSDAINVLDTIADAIKKGIGLDDNWFSVERLDWSINKTNPKIWIAIGQRNEDRYPCSSCGQFKEFDLFSKSRNSTYGISTMCLECQKYSRSFKKEQLMLQYVKY